MMQSSNSLEEFKGKLSRWADEHVMIGQKLANGELGKVFSFGRYALPEGLQQLALPAPTDMKLNASPRAIYGE